MEHKENSFFMYLNEDAKAKVKEMTEEELNILAALLTHNLNKTLTEISDDIFKRQSIKH